MNMVFKKAYRRGKEAERSEETFRKMKICIECLKGLQLNVNQ